jgi:hypothetical protein
MKRAVPSAVLAVLAAAAFLPAVPAQAASGRDQRFFQSVEGQWSGPGEVVAGKYKGTRFTCNFTGTTPSGRAGMTLDGTCRVGVFTQKMSARVVEDGRNYHGTFLDGAKGKGLDVVGGTVEGRRVVFSLVRNALRGTMLARLPDDNTMNVTISVRVNDSLVPVIGVSLKREGGPAAVANRVAED